MNVYIGKERLPSAYQEVEYIQSSGTQYIKIGTSFKTSYKSVIDFQMDVIGGDYIPLGITNYDSVNVAYRYGIDVYSSYFQVNAGGDWIRTIAEDTNRHTITIDKNTAIVDGTSYTINYSNYTYSSGICVFCYNEYKWNPQYYYKSSNKLYKLDIYDENGIHIYDLVPCYRKSDNVIGLYDLVNSVFYTNQGTGTFSKGNDVTMSELKNAYIGEYEFVTKYQEVEYIGSSGTQYINTDIKLNQTHTIELKLNINSNLNQWDKFYGGGDDGSMLFAQYEKSSGTAIQNRIKITNKSSNNMYSTNPQTISAGGTHIFIHSNTSFYIDGISQSTTTATTFTMNTGLNIFAMGNSQSTGREKSSYKLYYMKIYNSNSSLAYDLVPCYRKSDNVIGLYDLVNNQFYTNAGSGTFTKGPDVN